MAHDVIMPQMGESIAEGTVTTWLKGIGEVVERDEPLFEISTDKVDAEIPSPVSGTLLEIIVQPGTTVAINAVVAIIGEAGEKASTAAVSAEASPAHAAPTPSNGTAAAPAAVPAPAAQTAPGGEASLEERRRTKSSPVVRKIAAEHNIELSQLTGSGVGGRVTKTDIMAYLSKGASAQAPRASVPAAPIASVMAASVAAPSAGAGPHAALEIPAAYRARAFEGDRVEDMSPMRQKIAEHMVMSRRISAHVQTVFDVDFTHVDRLRKKYKAKWQEQHGVKLTFTSFVMKVLTDALKAHPVLNAALDGNQVIYRRDVNLGLAVALDWGLIVPVIHGANELNLLGISRRANDLAQRAKDKKLKPDEVAGGSFTLTNPGVFGNLFGLPIINQPQVAILGMGGVEKRPVVVTDADGTDAIAIRTRAYLSLSFDHRVVDGATADQFMGRIKKGIAEFDEADL